jgi:3-hydroxymyristoyl/3-hydroxydecanoyl-(acyl carrier protein) dehydratase
VSPVDRDVFLERCLADIKLVENTPTRVSLSGTLKPHFPGFEGHFPGKPLLAGAFQIELITAIAGRLIDRSWVPSCIEHARFRKMVRPGDTIRLQASLDSRELSRASVKAILFLDAHKACQATLVFSAG